MTEVILSMGEVGPVRHPRLRRAFLICIACLALSSPCAVARQEPVKPKVAIRFDGTTVRLALGGASLNEVARALNRELHVSLLIDTPPRGEQVDLQVEGSIPEVVKAVCKKFDFVWEPISSCCASVSRKCRRARR